MTQEKGSQAEVGPVAHHREGLAQELAAQGYRPKTIEGQLLLVERLDRWLVKENLTLAELTGENVRRFECFRRRGDGTGHELALTPILGYLRSQGECPEVVVPTPAGPLEELVERYRRYLVGERGLGARFDTLAWPHFDTQVGPTLRPGRTGTGPPYRRRRGGVLQERLQLGLTAPGACWA